LRGTSAIKGSPFQTRFNVNFEDYLKIYEKFKQLAGGAQLGSWAIGSILQEAKAEIRFLEQQGNKSKIDHAKEIYKRLEALATGVSKRNEGAPETDATGDKTPHEKMDHVPGGDEEHYEDLSTRQNAPSETGPASEPNPDAVYFKEDNQNDNESAGNRLQRTKRWPHEQKMSHPLAFSNSEIIEALENESDESGEAAIDKGFTALVYDINNKIPEGTEKLSPDIKNIIPLAKRIIKRIHATNFSSGIHRFTKEDIEDDMVYLMKKALKELPKYIDQEIEEAQKKEKFTAQDILDNAIISYDHNQNAALDASHGEHQESKKASYPVLSPYIVASKSLNQKTINYTENDNEIAHLFAKDLKGMSVSIASKFLGVQIEKDEYKAALR
jgi:hypothetical protein